MNDKLIKEDYEGLDGGCMGCEEVASAWIETWQRPDGSTYTKRVLRAESYRPNAESSHGANNQPKSKS